MEQSSSEGNRVAERANAIRAALRRDLPRLSLRDGPKAFGWAPTRHFRASLARGQEIVKVVIRQSWTYEDHDLQRFLYRNVLPHLAVRTAAFIGEFELGDGGPGWIVLEDMGEDQAYSDRPEHRAAYLRAIGNLHGAGEAFVAGGYWRTAPLPRFTPNPEELDGWQLLLAKATHEGGFGIGEWAAHALNVLRQQLAASPEVLLHGDTDFSNAMICGEVVALVDWEKARIGPPGLDLGPIVRALASCDELNAYCQGFSEASGNAPTMSQVRRWARDGETYECIRWICHYIKASLDGAPPPHEWRERFYDPCLVRLQEIGGA